MRNAVAILRYVQERGNEPVAMSQIARELGLNGSTCFNLLKTLTTEGLLAYDEATKTYELGLGLVELASGVDSHGQVVETAIRHATRLVDEIELACLLVRPTPNEDFLVVDKVESRKPIKVTVAAGERFPGNSSVLAKSYYAWTAEQTVDDVLDRLGLPAYSPKSIRSTVKFKRELKRVRTLGYATSVGEFYPDHNALAAPIFDRSGRVSHLLVIVGFAFQLPPETLDEFGARLRGTAATVTRELGGKPPPGLPDF